MDTDRRLTRYLLGLLSDEETERLDESSIADDGIAWRLRTIENALVDDYVRGALPADILGAFEARYLASPRGRKKVRFAARFVRTVDAAEAAATDEIARSLWRTFSPSGTIWAFRVPLAAALLLIVSALVLRDAHWQRASHDREPGRIARRGPASEPSSAPEPRRQAHDSSPRVPSSDAERGHRRVSEPAPAGTPAAITRPPTASTSLDVAVVLFPQTRSANTYAPGTTGPAGDTQPTVAMPRDAAVIVLDLRLDVSDFSRYAASVIDLSTDRTVWRSARVAPSSSADRPAVSITVPASVLASRLYAIELSGVTSSGETEAVATYVFNIARGR